MTTGEKIKFARKQQKMTQKDLGDLIGVSASAIGQFETNPNPPKLETLEKIAVALKIPMMSLIETASLPLDIEIEQKLSHIGYSIGYLEEEGSLWINYPNGTLEISDNDLKALNESVNDFLKFQLEQLRIKHEKDFRPYKIAK
ncbi:MAG: helix-turn-helix transcriptional regulator [Blautia sp.]|nr:helix-turn-helix transcriptional regulator [Blautia sp.]